MTRAPTRGTSLFADIWRARIRRCSVTRTRYVSGEGATALAISGAEPTIPAPGGPEAPFAAARDLIEAAGYDAEVSDDGSAVLTRPEPDRLDRFFVLSQSDELAVFVDTDPIPI